MAIDGIPNISRVTSNIDQTPRVGPEAKEPTTGPSFASILKEISGQDTNTYLITTKNGNIGSLINYKEPDATDKIVNALNQQPFFVGKQTEQGYLAKGIQGATSGGIETIV